MGMGTAQSHGRLRGACIWSLIGALAMLAFAMAPAASVVAAVGTVRCVTTNGSAPALSTASGCGALYSSLSSAVGDANGSSNDLILAFANTGATAASPTTFTGGVTISANMSIVGVGAVAIDTGAPVITVSTGTVTIANLAVTGGNNPGNSLGGGISVFSDTVNLTLIDLTVANNQAGNGGGIFIGSPNGSDTATIIDTTVANNSANSGGGIQANPGTHTIIHSTITGNTVSNGSNGGGIFDNSSTVTVRNSIVAGNNGSDTAATGFTGGITFPNSVVGDAGGLGSLGDHGGPTKTVDLTSDYAPYRTVPCATNPQTSQPIATDQRDAPRPTGGNTCDVGSYEFGAAAPAFPVRVSTLSLSPGHTNNGYTAIINSSNGTTPYTYALIAGTLPPDLSLATNGVITGIASQSGAYAFTVEVMDAAGYTNVRAFTLVITDPNTTYYVGTRADSANPPVATLAQCANATNTTCSLRDAIAYATSGTDTIQFTAALSTGVQVFTLLNDQLIIGADVTITGAGASTTIVDGNAAGRVLAQNGGTLTITGMTLRNGNGDTGGDGGAVLANGNALTFNGSVVSGSTANDGGGMIIGGSTTVTLNDTTVSGNTASGSGGGIRNNGILNVNRSTFTANTAQSTNFGGGAIYSTNTLTVINSTFSGSTATTGHGGGVFVNTSGTTVHTTFTHTTFGGNTAPNATESEFYTNGGVNLRNSIINGGCTDFFGGRVNSLDFNLMSDGGCFANNLAHDVAFTNPNLGPLQNNGGPTTTHALNPGSAAINKIPNGGGCNNANVTTDQRGTTRPQPSGGACDIGAFELAPSVVSFGVANFPSPQTAGAAGSVTVTAKDAGGAAFPGYTGAVHFTSSDAQTTIANGGLPGDYTFVAGDNGVHTFSVILKTAGAQSITVNDAAIPSITGSQTNIMIVGANATTLTVAGHTSPIVAGTSGTATVTLRDAYNNVATGYTGTVHFTSSDAQATKPADYTFIAGDNGIHVFTNGITLKTAGTQGITATDIGAPTLTSTQSGIIVTTAAPSQFLVTGYPSPAQANASNTFTVIAKDAYGNTASGYGSTAHFTSDDGQAVLPADYLFTPADAGIHFFSATLKTVGTRSITATDTLTPSFTGAQSNIAVTASGATTITANGGASPQTTVVNTPFGTALGVTVKDGADNAVSGVTVTFTAPGSGASGTFPGGVAINVATNASGVAAPVFTANGIGGGYTVSASVPGVASPATFSLTNTPGNATSLVITALPNPTQAGVSAGLTVTAKDASGNVVTGYQGTVHFTTTDGAATLPGDYHFTAGDGDVHAFTATFRTVGPQSLTVTDTGASSVDGTQSLQVNPGPASTILVSGYPSPIPVNVSNGFTVIARDAFGNTASAYTGMVHFTSDDGQATLPADYTFTVMDAGVHVFSASFANPGPRGITASDGSITGTQSAITVTAAAASTVTANAGTTPQSAVIGHGMPNALAVTVKDSSSHPAPNVPVTFAAPAGGARGTFAGNAASAVVNTDASGVATAPTFTAGTVAGPYTVSVTVPGIGTSTPFALTNLPDAADHFVLSATSSVTAGSAFSLTVTAADSAGNTVTGYTGTVHLSSTDVQAALGNDYTFAVGAGNDNGVHTFSITLKSAGGRSITVTQSAVTGSLPFTVTAATAATITANGSSTPQTATVGTPFGTLLAATVLDGFGNPVSGLSVTFTAPGSGASGKFTGNVTTVSATTNANGVATATTFSANTTAGSSFATANLTTGPLGTPASFSLTNSAGPPNSISPTAGSGQSATVGAAFLTALSATVRDASNNPVSGAVVTFIAPGNGSSGSFAGGVNSVSITTDGSGVATAPTFTANTTATAGTYPVSASAPGVASPATFSLTNNPGAASVLVISSLPNPTQAGIVANLSITARDAFGNTATGYTGTVHFTSTDGQAVLPANDPFVAGDSGSHPFAATFKTVGAQTITVTDTVTSITGNQLTQVIPGPAASITVTGYPSPVTVSAGNAFTVIAKDALGNTASNYRGTIHFTSTDSQAVLPANYVFTSADQGVHTFAATFKTVGTQTITATDTVTSITGNQSSISVAAAAATSLALSAPANAPAGTPFSVTVTAKDALNNTVTGYAHTVRFTSSDAQAVLPADYTFVAADNGAHTFSVTLKVAGSKSVTTTDLSISSINGSATVAVSGPTAASIAPIFGPAGGGTTVTITGTNLTGANVSIGGVACGSVTVNGAGTSLTCVTGAHLTPATVSVVITTASGAVTLTAAFTYAPPNVAPLPGTRPGGAATSGGSPSPLPSAPRP
jgi:hypothetical protein